jgi:hypothetical protein
MDEVYFGIALFVLALVAIAIYQRMRWRTGPRWTGRRLYGVPVEPNEHIITAQVADHESRRRWSLLWGEPLVAAWRKRLLWIVTEQRLFVYELPLLPGNAQLRTETKRHAGATLHKQKHLLDDRVELELKQQSHTVCRGAFKPASADAIIAAWDAPPKAPVESTTGIEKSAGDARTPRDGG